MFTRLSQWWSRYGFEILVVLSIGVIIILAIFRSGKQGTWSTSYYYPGKYTPSKTPSFESKGEIECRRVLREIFGRPFNKSRPDILSNPVTGGGHNLELDCYDHNLRLAVEYNGVQHYKFTPFFHRNKEAFLNQKYRDELKRRMCRDNGITLIEVPYTVKVHQIRSYLLNELYQRGYLN